MGDTAPIRLVRHADALARSAWEGDDALRPLTVKGHRQAAALARASTGLAIGRLVSSPALRCAATLEPLSGTSGLRVELADWLGEGESPAEALERLGAAARELGAPAALVACSHGDVISGVLALLAARGIAVEGPPGVPKAGVFELDLADRRVRSLPPA